MAVRFGSSASEDKALIGIIDDDEPVRTATSSLIRSAGYRTQLFESAEAFLGSSHPDQPDCLILDVLMPGMSGLELQSVLSSCRCQVPIIFVSACRDDRIFALALQRGASACLPKPVDDGALLTAVASAVSGNGDSKTGMPPKGSSSAT